MDSCPTFLCFLINYYHSLQIARSTVRRHSRWFQALDIRSSKAMSRTVQLSLRSALQIAQNSQTEHIDPRITQILEDALAKIWRNVQAQPNSYIMSELEFAVFNRYRSRPEFQNETARKAVSRYWNSRSANNGVRMPIPYLG